MVECSFRDSFEKYIFIQLPSNTILSVAVLSAMLILECQAPKILDRSDIHVFHCSRKGLFSRGSWDALLTKQQKNLIQDHFIHTLERTPSVPTNI